MPLPPVTSLISTASLFTNPCGVKVSILITPEIQQTIEMNPSEREIEKAAATQGILTMEQDGVIKILQGVTTLDELERVLTIE